MPDMMKALAGMPDQQQSLPPRPVRPEFTGALPTPGILGVGSGRPMQGNNAARQLYREDMREYRGDMRDWRRQYFESLLGGGNPPGQQANPVAPPIPAQNPQGMVGQSLYVQGMRPGASAFDLPTY